MARDIAQAIENNGKSDSVAFVIDDRVDVVWQARHKGIKVDGVHIGQTDYGTAGGPRAARRGCHRGPVRRDRKPGEADQRAACAAASTTSAPARYTCPPPSRRLPLGGNDGSGHTLDEAQINAICAASDVPGSGRRRRDTPTIWRCSHHSKAAGWFVVSAIAGAKRSGSGDPRIWCSRWKAVRGDAKHGYAPRVT